VIGRMIFGMIRNCMVALLLSAAMLAQDAPLPKVRVVFPKEVHSEKASMTYGLHDPTGWHNHGVSMASSASPFEISVQNKTVDRFKALVWAPGCKMKEFDYAVGTSDIKLQFVCDPLKTIPFCGRIKSVDNLASTTISVDYNGGPICAWMNDACKNGCVGSCGPLQIFGIATAKVTPDGSFKMALPDFSRDPIASDSFAGLDFWLHGVGRFSPPLLPQLPEGQTLRVAASYPTEVVFVPMELRDLSRSNEVERKMYELAPFFCASRHTGLWRGSHGPRDSPTYSLSTAGRWSPLNGRRHSVR